jgi:hypothetical protein
MEGYKPYTPKPKRTISQPEIGEFKGNKTLSIPVGKEGEAFTFGYQKAKAILVHLKAIEMFVTEGEKEFASKPTPSPYARRE